MIWIPAIEKEKLPKNGSTAILYKGKQIALFYFASENKIYAAQNFCPHKNIPVLGRGMIGDTNGIPKVACPMHKRTFSLITGEGISDSEYSIKLFNVKEENGFIYIEVPENLDEIPDSKICQTQQKEKI